MTDITPESATRCEADVRERAGEITHTQGLAIIRRGRPDPLATLALQQTATANTLAAALRELHSVCLAMDAGSKTAPPTEADYQDAMRAAVKALAQH